MANNEPPRESSFQQQAAMVRYLAEVFGANIEYKSENGKCVAFVTLPGDGEGDGETKKFNVYGY